MERTLVDCWDGVGEFVERAEGRLVLLEAILETRSVCEQGGKEIVSISLCAFLARCGL